MEEETSISAKVDVARLKKTLLFSGIILATLLVVYLLVVGVGLYVFRWRGNWVKWTAKVFPYPAGWVRIYPITFAEVFREVGHAQKFYQQTGGMAPSEAELEAKAIDTLLRFKLVEVLSAQYHLRVQPEEVQKTLNQLYEENGGKESFEEIVWQFYGLRPAEVKRLIFLTLLEEKLYRYFEDNLRRKIHLAHILIQDEKQAKKVFKLAEKQDFSALAKKYSKDKNTKEKGGELGYFAPDELASVIAKGKELDRKLYLDFKKKVWGAKEGKVFLFHTPRGWQIIKVLGYRGEVDKKYEEWFKEKQSEGLILKFI